eukprot:COSAG02_NODE_714_length_18094_cov_13.275688_9_plen_71_part_00
MRDGEAEHPHPPAQQMHRLHRRPVGYTSKDTRPIQQYRLDLLPGNRRNILPVWNSTNAAGAAAAGGATEL